MISPLNFLSFKRLNSDIFSLVLSSLFRGPKSGSRMLLTGDQNGGGYRPGIWWGSRQRGWCSLDFRSLEKHACDAKYKIIPFRQEIRIPWCGRASVGRHEIRIRCHIKLTWGLQTWSYLPLWFTYLSLWVTIQFVLPAIRSSRYVVNIARLNSHLYPKLYLVPV